MSRHYRQENPRVESRYLWASILFIAVFATLTIRLWYIQIYQGDYYRKISMNNHIRRFEIPAPRGMIFDRQEPQRVAREGLHACGDLRV